MRKSIGSLEGVTLLGDPPPTDEESAPVTTGNKYSPRVPDKWEDLGLESAFLFDMVLAGHLQPRADLRQRHRRHALAVPYPVIGPLLLTAMRKQTLIDIVGQRPNTGDGGFIYEIKPPKGAAALQEALDKTSYVGPLPVPFSDYVEAVLAQTVKKDHRHPPAAFGPRSRI